MFYNLKEYHRPTDLAEAYRLLQRTDIRTIALASGVAVAGEAMPDVEAVVDLSDAGLDFIKREGDLLQIGAMTRLQTIVDELGDVADGLLSCTAHLMAGWHVRNMATVSSPLAMGDIHMPLSVALAALGARVELYRQSAEPPSWAELTSKAQGDGLRGELVTAISIRRRERIGAAYEQVGRTPADRPIVCVAAVAYPVNSGYETYTATGGLLHQLMVIEHTFREASLTDEAVETMATRVIDDETPSSAYLDDYLGSADYRRGVAPVLARRALTGALARAGAHPA